MEPDFMTLIGERRVMGQNEADPDIDPYARAEQEEADRAKCLRREYQFRGMFDVKVASERPRKTESERLHLSATTLAPRLRDHVTMPADLNDPTLSFLDVNSG